jgi:hypothetical protein
MDRYRTRRTGVRHGKRSAGYLIQPSSGAKIWMPENAHHDAGGMGRGEALPCPVHGAGNSYGDSSLSGLVGLFDLRFRPAPKPWETRPPAWRCWAATAGVFLVGKDLA